MKIQDAYTRWSTTYDSDRNRTRDLDRRVTESTLGDRNCQNVLELGCGTGKNTALLDRIGRKILALDFSPGMLEQAKAKLKTDHVFFVRADLTKPWPTKTGSFELVVCNLVLEHIEDLDPIFYQASQSLTAGGEFFVSELHPFRQYQGTQANFRNEQETVEIDAFVHHLSDFTEAARENGLSLKSMNEWWHEEDLNKPPRLVSFLFEKR
ncbi:MAG TPA: class I SAM-dependent methyltransferase [Pyrinomonadaceae bacterium]